MNAEELWERQWIRKKNLGQVTVEDAAEADRVFTF